MNTSGLSFPEAVERLATDAGLEMPVETPEAREQARRQAGLHEVMEAACQWFEAQLRTPAGATALNYLKGRGLRDENDPPIPARVCAGWRFWPAGGAEGDRRQRNIDA